MNQWKTPLHLAVALTLIAAAAMIFDQKSGDSSFSSISQEARAKLALSRPTLDRINHHLQTTEGKKDLLTLATEVENEKFHRPIQDGEYVPDRQTSSALDSLETEDGAGAVIRTLESERVQGSGPVLPEDRIRSQVEQEKWLNRYNEKQRQEFVKTVISNAQAAGYAIAIDSKSLNVTSIRRNPNALPSQAQGRPTAAN